MAAAFLASWLAFYYLEPVFIILPGIAIVLFYLVFRDPRREIPASPLGVVSPVDGRIRNIDLVDRGVLQGEAHRIFIEVDILGTYTARSPVEGSIRDLNTIGAEKVVDYRTNALWVQTDEKEDVVLQFRGYRLGLAPRAFVRYGERLGQGQRCAYVRLAKFAEVHLPIESKILVGVGQKVTAGLDLIGKLPPQ